MKKIELDFNFKVRMWKDGSLQEADVFLNVIETDMVRAVMEYVREPYKFYTADDNDTPEQATEKLEKINAEMESRLLEKVTLYWSKKNKDIKPEDLVKQFIKYPERMQKVMVKWVEVCHKNTFLGIELDKDS